MYVYVCFSVRLFLHGKLLKGTDYQTVYQRNAEVSVHTAAVEHVWVNKHSPSFHNQATYNAPLRCF